MYRYAIVCIGYLLYLSTATGAEEGTGSRSDDNNEANIVTGVLTNLNVTHEILEVSYQIRNGSDQDVWLCEFIDKVMVSERYLAEDGQTLVVRRRLSVPMNATPFEQPIGRYLRLRSGESRTESLVLNLPISYSPVFEGPPRVLPHIVYAKRLVIEVGYYVGNLPGKIFSLLEQAESNDTVPFVRRKQLSGRTFRDWLRGSLIFNRTNEQSRDRDEEVVMPWINQSLHGEQVLAIVANDLHIPYKSEPQSPKYRSFDLPSCTGAKIHYQPSALEYFLPYAAQRSLLNATETQYLRSLRDVEVNKSEDMKVLASELSRGVTDGIAVVEGCSAHVVCYRDSERLTSFTIYDDRFIETEDKQRLRFYQGLEGLKVLTPQIQPFEVRVQCAANLKNLWYRLRLYDKAEKVRLKQSSGASQMRYPVSTGWCDAMVSAYKSIGMLDKFIMKPYICPGAGEGKCHYAMDPNCMSDSPGDMVLLFETKTGWNQHGGPELFTFDNHDPKGGCVLLNDGTVKFIRTTEELQQLHWK